MPEIDPDEFQNIRNLEAEIQILFDVELNLKNDRSKLPSTLNSLFALPALYDDQSNLSEVLRELKSFYRVLSERSRDKGKVLGTKQLNRFLDDSERVDRKQRQLRLISQASANQASRQLSTTFARLEKEFDTLKGDIKIFRSRMRDAGFSSKQQLNELARIGAARIGFQRAFTNKMTTLSAAIHRGEQAAGQMDSYLLEIKRDEKFQWITISANTCPDCRARAGKILSFSEWRSIGLPRTGFTVCDIHCHCQLMPLPMAEKMFPTVKEFKRSVDNDVVVLTPASVVRKLGSKRAQPVNN